MKPKLLRFFLFSAGLVLSLTAAAKIITSGGSVRVLQTPDPILLIPFRYVFLIAGVTELAVAIVCLFGRRVELQAGAVAWLATSFVVYRLGLLWIGYTAPCGCLGKLTDALHIPPQAADEIMKGVLAYLLLGSYATLAWLWLKRRQIASSPGPTLPVW